MATDLIEAFLPRLRAAVQKLAEESKVNLRYDLSEEGHVRPFIVSAPGQPPKNWDGRLLNTISIEPRESSGWLGWTIMVTGAAQDPRDAHPGNIAAAEEFGHFWDGWAQDFEDGYKWVWICKPHWVAPRPFMGPLLDWVAGAAHDFLQAQVDAPW